jgi:predicted nucleic acid-binding protein
MILVDTSIIVAWLDPKHPAHQKCSRALDHCGAVDELAISSVTFAELAAGGRNREALDEDLRGFIRVELGFDAAFRAGAAFGRWQPGRGENKPVLPDFLIRGQAAIMGARHLTNDRRRLGAFPDVDFLFPLEAG